MVDWLQMVLFFEWFWKQELTELTQIIPPITSNDHQEISRAWQPVWLFSWGIYDSLATSNLCLCGPSSRTPFVQTSTESNQKNRIYVVFSNGFTWFLTWLDILVGGLEHDFIFPYIGKNHPNWRTYFFKYIFHRGKYTTNQIRYLFTRLFGTMIPPLIALSIFLGFSQARSHHGIAPDSGGFCEEAVPCRKSLSNIAGSGCAWKRCAWRN